MREGGSAVMMITRSRLANRVIDRILVLSADAQIERRKTAKDTWEFHNLSGAIAAYGKALALLLEVREQEELRDLVRELSMAEGVADRVH